ncbi:MAG: hypothetical protein IPM02_01830 [Betaproteobacteria bacterium]|nr:hypothetical protein [Betaproteobacteria bacterium]
MYFRIFLCMLMMGNALAAAVLQVDVGAASCNRPAKSAVGPDGSFWVPCSLSPGLLLNAKYQPGGALTFAAVPVPAVTNSIAAVTFGPDGLLWFVTGSTVGKFDTASGATTVYPMIGGNGGAFDIAVGGDGNIWINKYNPPSSLVKVRQDGQMQEFPLPDAANRRPVFIGAGSDGNIWYTDELSNRIGRVTPGGAFADFDIGSNSEGIVAGADGNMWAMADNGLARVTPGGQVTIFPYPPGGSNTFAVAAAPDGTLWYADAIGRIGQAATTGQTSALQLPPNSAPLFVTVRPGDGVVFFTEYNLHRIGVVAPAAATASDTAVIEFYNTGLNHYFVTANAGEAAGIDAGAAGPGWVRTGETWRAWLAGPLPNAAEVCRFYGTEAIDPATGLRRDPNSHFYTLEAPECTAVKQDPGWTYEAPNKYWLLRPASSVAAGCGPGTTPIYRVYNNRFAFNDSNHRYMTRTALYDQMRAQGWMGEGVVMCAPG